MSGRGLRLDVAGSHPRIAAVAAGPSGIYKWRPKASQGLLEHGRNYPTDDGMELE